MYITDGDRTWGDYPDLIHIDESTVADLIGEIMALQDVVTVANRHMDTMRAEIEQRTRVMPRNRCERHERALEPDGLCGGCERERQDEDYDDYAIPCIAGSFGVGSPNSHGTNDFDDRG